MKNTHQVREDSFPNTKFKFMQEIWYEDLVKVESMFGESNRKSVLWKVVIIRV